MMNYREKHIGLLALLLLGVIWAILFSKRFYANHPTFNLQGILRKYLEFNNTYTSINSSISTTIPAIGNDALPVRNSSISINVPVERHHPTSTYGDESNSTLQNVMKPITDVTSTGRIPGKKPVSPTPRLSAGIQNCKGERRKAVIIHAPARSGSTFLGELFNQHSEVYYLFEPLYEIGYSSQEVRQEIIRDLFLCDYSRIPKIYENIKDYESSKCGSNVCFYYKSNFLWRNTKLCTQDPPRCGVKTLDPHELEKVCRQSLFTALKVIRLQSLMELVPLLTDPRIDLKVIQLVRDPRAVVPSSIKMLGIKRKSTSLVAKQLCYRYHNDWLFHQRCILRVNVNESFNIDPMYCNETTRKLWNGRFIRLSHEFVSEHPSRAMTIIYEFIGLNYDKSVTEWVQSSTNGRTKSKGGNGFYGTVRDSRKLLQQWRLSQPFSQVQEIQKQCDKAMQELGYLTATTVKSLLNITKNLYSNEKSVYMPTFLQRPPSESTSR